MLPAKSHYIFAAIPFYVGMVPGALIDRVALVVWPGEWRHGFRIVAPEPQTRSEFVNRIHDALQLIARCDPMRFDRLRREIRSIIVMPTSMGGASYSRLGRICCVDLRSISQIGDSIIESYGVACTLIHEMTHGLLCSRRIIQCRRNHLRVEKLCCKEMVRFSRRSGVAEFDWEELAEAEPPNWSDRIHWLREEVRRVKNSDWSNS